MSFAFTAKQYLDGTKTVTRRIGWDFLKTGDVCNGVLKSRGLKKGEHVKVLGRHRIVSIYPERLNSITLDDVVNEGFPNFSREDFIQFFCAMNKCRPETFVNRIEFERIPDSHV